MKVGRETEHDGGGELLLQTEKIGKTSFRQTTKRGEDEPCGSVENILDQKEWKVQKL